MEAAGAEEEATRADMTTDITDAVATAAEGTTILSARAAGAGGVATGADEAEVSRGGTASVGRVDERPTRGHVDSCRRPAATRGSMCIRWSLRPACLDSPACTLPLLSCCFACCPPPRHHPYPHPPASPPPHQGGGRGRGRGRYDGDRQAATQREPPPTDLEFVAELKGHSKKVCVWWVGGWVGGWGGGGGGGVHARGTVACRFWHSSGRGLGCSAQAGPHAAGCEPRVGRAAAAAQRGLLAPRPCPLLCTLPLPASLPGPQVTTVLMDETGGQLFTGSFDGTVRVWSCTTGQVGGPWLRGLLSATSVASPVVAACWGCCDRAVACLLLLPPPRSPPAPSTPGPPPPPLRPLPLAQCVSTVQVGGEVSCMLIFAGFLFVGLKTTAGTGQVKAWHMATSQEYAPMTGHTVGARWAHAGHTFIFSRGAHGGHMAGAGGAAGLATARCEAAGGAAGLGAGMVWAKWRDTQ